VEDDDQEEVERVREWIGRLNAFTSSLDDIEEEGPIDLCEKACEAWQASFTENPPRPATAAALVVLETLQALMDAAFAATVDYYKTPDVRDRMTRDDVLKSLREALRSVRQLSEQSLSNGLPSAEVIKQRNNSAITSMQRIKEAADKLQAQDEAHEAEAAADPYGAIFLHLDPSRSDAPIMEKVSSLTEDDDRRYRDAYERLRRMIDSELLEHISDESDRLCDVVMALLIDLRDNRISLFDEDAWDEHRRKIRSALISFTTALYSHREQTVRAAKKAFNRGPEVQAVEKLFDELRKTSFEYGWLEELRGALQHGDINAFRWGFGASMDAEPTANVYMSREFMLDFTRNSSQKKWLKRRELEDMESDPSVLDMIKAVQPLMGPLQEELDKILYPNVADDVATVRELLSRYPHPNGLHALQNGPGFTRRNPWPPLSPLAPRVLRFVVNYEPNDVIDDQASGDADGVTAP